MHILLHKTYLVYRVDDPVNPWVTTNGFMLRINKDDFKVFVGRILVDPVGVQHPQIGAAATNAFFGSRFQRPLVFELIDTLVGRLACGARQL